jgi:hypothetical protein
MDETLTDKTFTKEELESISVFSDNLQDHIEAAVKRGSILLNPIRKELSLFADKNSDVLQSNIIGKRLLFNKQTEENIMKAIGLDTKELLKLFKESEYFRYFGHMKLKDQIVFSIPIIMLVKEFYKKGKVAEAQFLYSALFYKPYATIVFKYFGKRGFEVNEDQMRYTIENLSQRYDIKKEGTLYGVLIKKAQTSFEHYIAESKSEKLTDRELHIIFALGIYSNTNNFVNQIFGEYLKNKGKRLYFEDPTFQGTGDSEGETFDKDVQSDAAIKSSMVRRAVSSVNKKPVDEKLLDIAAKYGFVGLGNTFGDYNFSNSHTDRLKNILIGITEKHFKDLPLFFESLIGSFLFELSQATGKKYGADDLRTAVFVNSSVKTFSKSPNNKNENNLRVRSMIEEFLMSTSDEYINAAPTKRQQIKKAVHFYFVLVVQKG